MNHFNKKNESFKDKPNVLLLCRDATCKFLTKFRCKVIKYMYSLQSQLHMSETSNFLKLFLKLTVTLHATDFNPLYITVLQISSLTHDDRKKLTNGASMHVD